MKYYQVGMVFRWKTEKQVLLARAFAQPDGRRVQVEHHFDHSIGLTPAQKHPIFEVQPLR